MKRLPEENYITREELIKQGFIRRPEGGYKRLTVLERYAERGWLDFGDKNFSAEDRVNTGLRLYSDFYHSRIVSEGVADLTRVRVDGGNNQHLPEFVLSARSRFIKAFRSIPANYVPIVGRVCLDDKEFGILRSSEDYRHMLEVAKENLCLGIDNLIYHYRGKPRNLRPKIQGYSLAPSIWENFDEYCKQFGY